MDIRIGQGYDSHRLVADRPLILGGITIPHSHGLAGHSDADALLHAVIDALLGALALGNIGQHFPDTDARYRDIDSRQLLRHTYRLVQQQGYCLINLDSTLIAQEPKLAPYLEAMTHCIASDLASAPERVNVKAKTNEKMGWIGRAEGIAAQAVVLLHKA